MEVLAVKDFLQSQKVVYTIKDDIQPGRLAGFGTTDRAIHVFVKDEDYETALQLIGHLFKKE